jgi:hypothetical protein
MHNTEHIQYDNANQDQHAAAEQKAYVKLLLSALENLHGEKRPNLRPIISLTVADIVKVDFCTYY